MAQTANPAPAALHKFRYAPLELVSRREVIPATEHTLPVTLYRFRLPDGHRSGLATGHHLVVAAEVNGSYETRKYTPVSAPGAVGELDLLVKVYPDGVMSRHIDSLPIGASLDMKGPAGYFKYPRGGLPGISHLAMVGGGTGITPLISVLRELVNCPDDATKATLLYANRTEADILLRDELDRISQDKRVEVVHTLTRVSPPLPRAPPATARADSLLPGSRVDGQARPPYGGGHARGAARAGRGRQGAALRLQGHEREAEEGCAGHRPQRDGARHLLSYGVGRRTPCPIDYPPLLISPTSAPWRPLPRGRLYETAARARPEGVSHRLPAPAHKQRRTSNSATVISTGCTRTPPYPSATWNTICTSGARRALHRELDVTNSTFQSVLASRPTLIASIAPLPVVDAPSAPEITRRNSSDVSVVRPSTAASASASTPCSTAPLRSTKRKRPHSTDAAARRARRRTGR